MKSCLGIFLTIARMHLLSFFHPSLYCLQFSTSSQRFQTVCNMKLFSTYVLPATLIVTDKNNSTCSCSYDVLLLAKALNN